MYILNYDISDYVQNDNHYTFRDIGDIETETFV